MKIDKEKLVELLVEKTSMEKEDIENQLEQLIERIREAAERGKALEIKGFGLFYFDESDKLMFDPSEELSSEISYKYAGMKPVELNPERDTSFGVIDEKEDEILKDEQEEEPDEVLDEEPEQDPEKEIESIFDEPKQQEPVDEKIPESKPVKKQKVASQSNSINTVIVTFSAIIVIAILILGYFYFTDSVDTLADREAQQSPVEQEQLEPVPEETPEIVENPEVIPEQEQEAPDEVTVTEETDPPAETDQPEEQPIYGLMGSLMDQANDGYSIVIHSFNDEDTARLTAANLSNDGYRVLVSSRTVNADTVWRVSLGQFPTLNGAIQAAEDLPSPYNTQNFVQRIQLN